MTFELELVRHKGEQHLALRLPHEILAHQVEGAKLELAIAIDEAMHQMGTKADGQQISRFEGKGGRQIIGVGNAAQRDFRIFGLADTIQQHTFGDKLRIIIKVGDSIRDVNHPFVQNVEGALSKSKAMEALRKIYPK